MTSRRSRSAALVLAALLSLLAMSQPASAAGCTMGAAPSGGAPAGSTITLVGSGWDANDTIFVNLGGMQLGTFNADASGNVSSPAVVPALALGSYTLFAFNNAASCESNTPYDVITQPAPTTAAPTTAAPTTAAPSTTAPATPTESATTTAAPSTTTESATTTAAPSATTTTESATTMAVGLSGDEESSGSSPWLLVVLAIMFVGASFGAGVWWTKRSTSS